MNENQPREITLLLMACTVEVSAAAKEQVHQFLVNQPIDWHRLYALAVRHRLIPFVYRLLCDEPTVPQAFLSKVAQDYRANATDTLLKLHQYQELNTLLRHHAIDHLPLKGIRLTQRSYPHSSLRDLGDLDVLVSRDDVANVIQLAQTIGYQLAPQHHLHNQKAPNTLLTDLYEVSLIKPFANGSHFDLDLHWQLLGFNTHYAMFDLAYVRSEPTFTTERELVLLVLHHGVTNIWQQIYYVNDLYFLLTEQPIDWSWLLLELQKFGVERVFLAGLHWCWRIWRLDVPSLLQRQIASDAITSLANQYASGWYAEQPYEFSQLVARQALFFVRAQTQLTHRLHVGRTFLGSRLFRYSFLKIGARWVYIPSKAGLLTFPLRALSSLRRLWARNK